MATSKPETVVGGLNLGDILFLPFEAAANAQAKLTDKTLDFIRTFGLDSSNGLITTTISSYGTIDVSNAASIPGSKEIDGTTAGLPPLQSPLKYFQSVKSLTVPMISLFNIPALNMRAVTVDLAVEINQVTKSDASKSLGASTSYDNKKTMWGSIGGAFDVKASAASADTQSGSNTQKVKYQVHMEAANDPPVGLLRLLDWSMGIDNPPAIDYSRMKDTDLFKPMPSLAELNFSKKDSS
jgi:hypothetical protein